MRVLSIVHFGVTLTVRKENAAADRDRRRVGRAGGRGLRACGAMLRACIRRISHRAAAGVVRNGWSASCTEVAWHRL